MNSISSNSHIRESDTVALLSSLVDREINFIMKKVVLKDYKEDILQYLKSVTEHYTRLVALMQGQPIEKIAIIDEEFAVFMF